jgi:hypothetical protein
MPFKNFDPFTSFGGRIDPISEIRNAGIITDGDVWWVKNPSDASYTVTKDKVEPGKLKDNIQAGIDSAASDENDYVLVVPQDANAVWAIGTAIDVNEDRLHLISVGYTQTAVGYSNTVRGFATTSGGTPVDASMVDVTGAGCEIAGFRVLGTAGTSGGGTVTQLLRVGTHGLHVHDCAIEADDSAADTSLVAGVAATHGARFDNVTIAQLGTADSPATPINLPHNGQRWKFNDCSVLLHISAAGDEFINAGTGVIHNVEFNRCNFINTNAGTTPASIVVGSVTVDDGVILMNDCSSVNCDDFGTDPTVFVSPVASGTLNSLYNPRISSGTAAVTAS